MSRAYHESPAHQRAKQIVAEACQRAGYSVTVEAIGADWRADVLAVRGAVTLAFEVQWSPLKLAEALDRQARYARDGVRGCWLFRRAPGMGSSGDTDPGLARRDLPLFHLAANADGSFVIQLDRRLHDLDGFVTALVGGWVHFAEVARLDAPLAIDLKLFRLSCPACRALGYVPLIGGTVTAGCGARVEVSAAAGRAIAAAEDLTPLTGGAPLVRTGEDGAGICPACGGAIAARAVWAAGYGVQPEYALHGPIALRAPRIVPHAHWCLGGAMGWCG